MPANKFLKFLYQTIIAIYNDDELMIPHGDTLIEAGQDILAFGDEQAIGKLNEIFVS